MIDEFSGSQFEAPDAEQLAEENERLIAALAASEARLVEAQSETQSALWAGQALGTFLETVSRIPRSFDATERRADNVIASDGSQAQTHDRRYYCRERTVDVCLGLSSDPKQSGALMIISRRDHKYRYFADIQGGVKVEKPDQPGDWLPLNISLTTFLYHLGRLDGHASRPDPEMRGPIDRILAQVRDAEADRKKAGLANPIANL